MKHPARLLILGFLLFTIAISFSLSSGHASASTSVANSPRSQLLAVAVSTHGNVDFAGRAEESFQYVCNACHDPHGGTGNLGGIAKYVTVNMSPFTISGPVLFTSLTGTNSFDDGVSAATSRICVACHVNANRPGSATAMSHTGGFGHLSGDDYSGQDCTTCHLHDLDGNPATVDGFMPAAGSCVSCHKMPQVNRRQIVDSNGDGTGTGGDFKRASHHVFGSAIPTDDDCKACHDQSQHRGGVVRLYNADNAATVYALDGNADPSDYENFCLSCHDGNGAQRLPVPTQPFSNSASPAAVDPTAWNAASHNTSIAVGSCINCHDNGHGSNKKNLLAPWNYANDGNADDPMKEQERFCYDCHDGAPAAVNVQSEFGLTSHHRIATSEQTANGVQLECVSCHNPHANNATNKVSNPDNLNQLATNNNTFCLACHDNLTISPLPTGVSFGTYAVNGFNSGGATTVWDKSKYINTIHYTGDAALPNIQCKHCHASHGASTSGYQDLLKASYTRNMGTSYYPPGTGFALCFGCHLWDDGKAGLPDVKNDAWAGEHGSHDDDGPCIYCHDVHAPYDAGEFGLVNFEYNRQYSDLTYLAGYNAGTAFDRTRNPPCGIACHGVSHATRRYTPPPDYDTTPVSSYPFGFAQQIGNVYMLQTATDPLVGTVNNPTVALQNGYFNGNGVDTYINFTSDPNAMLASTALVIDAHLMPQGIPMTVAARRNNPWSLFANYWISALLPKQLRIDFTTTSANYEAVIFDRGADSNYRLSILRNTDWQNYNPPSGVASFALWVNPVDKHNGADSKVAVTNYEKCPIVSDHWYSLKVQWDSSKPAKSPVDIFVDDQGTVGNDVGELWHGMKNCTDSNPAKALVPSGLQPWNKDQIKATPGDFTIGASVGTFNNVFKGLIQSLTIYPENAATFK